MRITFEALKILDTIARHDSFAAAADELNRVPSALTYALKKLEQDLDVALFDRSGYRTKLTPQGKELLEGGRVLLQQAEHLEYKIKSGKAAKPRTISIAYDDVISYECLEPLLTDLLTELPNVSFRLSAEILNGPWDALETGRADISIAASAELPFDSTYQYIPLGFVSFIFAVAPTHPLAHAPEPLSVHDIQQHRMVIVSDTSVQLPKLSSGHTPGHTAVIVPTIRAKLLAQMSGFGVGFLPKYLAQPYIEKGLLIEKNVERPKMGGRFVLAWNSAKESEYLLKTISIIEKDKARLFNTMQ